MLWNSGLENAEFQQPETVRAFRHAWPRSNSPSVRKPVPHTAAAATPFSDSTSGFGCPRLWITLAPRVLRRGQLCKPCILGNSGARGAGGRGVADHCRAVFCLRWALTLQRSGKVSPCIPSSSRCIGRPTTRWPEASDYNGLRRNTNGREPQLWDRAHGADALHQGRPWVDHPGLDRHAHPRPSALGRDRVVGPHRPHLGPRQWRAPWSPAGAGPRMGHAA